MVGDRPRASGGEIVIHPPSEVLKHRSGVPRVGNRLEVAGSGVVIRQVGGIFHPQLQI